jgi:hypothetical protein
VERLTITMPPELKREMERLRRALEKETGLSISLSAMICAACRKYVTK